MARIFISSTSKDLRDHRQELVAALRKAGHEPIAMEDFGSQDGAAKEVSFDELRGCEVFVGIYAHRYGYRPDGGRSVTELEYDEAERLKMRRLVFFIKEDYSHPLVNDNRETDPESLTFLRAFKNRLSNTRVRDYFTSPDNLATTVLASLSREAEKSRGSALESTPDQSRVSSPKSVIYLEKEDEQYTAAINSPDQSFDDRIKQVLRENNIRFNSQLNEQVISDEYDWYGFYFEPQWVNENYRSEIALCQKIERVLSGEFDRVIEADIATDDERPHLSIGVKMFY